MQVFILTRTVESLCHAATIEHPHFVRDNRFEQEVSKLLLAYLTPDFEALPCQTRTKLATQ